MSTLRAKKDSKPTGPPAFHGAPTTATGRSKKQGATDSTSNEPAPQHLTITCKTAT
ncbi:MAG: hypothetical protein OXF06_07345 [Bacteroidetes bacterium]|nr:hypothetical protein [Bacteroidota bacterium]